MPQKNLDYTVLTFARQEASHEISENLYLVMISRFMVSGKEHEVTDGDCSTSSIDHQSFKGEQTIEVIVLQNCDIK